MTLLSALIALTPFFTKAEWNEFLNEHPWIYDEIPPDERAPLRAIRERAKP